MLIEFLTKLRDAGLPVAAVYDIGACVGEWGKEVKPIFPDAQFVAFEANQGRAPALIQAGCYAHAVFGILSSPDRDEVDFHVASGTGDSYYRENTGWYDGGESFRVPCVTLDVAMEKANLPSPDFIKLDTQGSELDILLGAAKALETATLIQTEVPVVAYNIGAPAIADYLAFFRERDFLPVCCPSSTCAEDILIHLDFIFMRRDAKEKYLGANKHLRV